MNPNASDVPTALPPGVKWKQIGLSLPKARESFRLSYCWL